MAVGDWITARMWTRLLRTVLAAEGTGGAGEPFFSFAFFSSEEMWWFFIRWVEGKYSLV